MKRFTILFACLALNACALGASAAGLPPSPRAVAQQTILDEQAALGVELAYQAAALAALTAIRAGFVDDATKAKIGEADRVAYAALLTVRGAYDAGNASGYLSALTGARAAVSSIMNLVKGN